MGNIQEQVVIRSMQQADVETLMLIKEAEGWNQTEEDWQLMMVHDPELCLVAIVDNQIVGSVTALNYNNQVAWIGMMLVSKGFRGLGIGKLLLRTVIGKLKACSSIKLDATPSGKLVYNKLGFVKEYEIYRMATLDLPAAPGYENTGDILPVSGEGRAAVAKIDLKVFGSDRSGLIRILISNHPGMAWLLKDENQITGYILGRKGSRYTHIGPLFAPTVNDAKALISNTLKYLAGQPVVLDVPEYQQALKDWLPSLGFTTQRPLTRMYLKSNSFPGMIKKQFLIGGPEIG